MAFSKAKEKGFVERAFSLRKDQSYFISVLASQASEDAGRSVTKSEIIRGIIDSYAETIKKGNA